MHHIAINVQNDQLAEKVLRALELFKGDDIEIVSIEDLEDLKVLQATRDESSIPFEDYLAHAD
ncbi:MULTISPECIES: hypothetical protein [Thiorhodovibrio]|uniref:hypothetical protein n=1 Tax=Thiorhodovibrio TaxID=61593 RepID=UPI001912B16D|nr:MULTISPECIES: hypothetical protein [Thiorhodovibrio]MBK5970356.1 hypothetical protein [Thiorhodovibrio winogradskyi]WPL10424.1 hypothetical protein Thiosp_00136 [Thiorhodovibrio litoralis]